MRCLEVAVHPNTSDNDNEVIAAAFQRTAEGLRLSRVCIEFTCAGMPLADLAQLKDMLERLNHDNLALGTIWRSRKRRGTVLRAASTTPTTASTH